MPKTRQQKEEAVKKLTNQLAQTKGAVFAHFDGLTVNEVEKLRKLCREQGVEYSVFKKTLMKLVFEQSGLSGVSVDKFTRGVALATSAADEVTPAKVLADFAKGHKALQLIGGILEKKYIDGAMVGNLAKLPGKHELLGRVVGTIQAPISGFVNVLAGNLRGLVQVLKAVGESKG